MPHPWPVRIAGLGRYLPERVVTNAEIAAQCDIPEAWIESNCGVQERRWAQPSLGESNSFMAAEAVREALAEAQIEAETLDLIVNASGTPEQIIPDGGPLIQRQLGIDDSGVPCMSVHSTCLSFLHGLQLAGSLIAGGTHQRIVVVSSENASVGVKGAAREAVSLFGDAAAAVVLTPTPAGEASAIDAIRFETYGSAAHLTEVRGGGSRCHPNDPKTVASDNQFQMDGPAILRFCLGRAEGFLERLRPGLAQDLGDIDCVAPHQPSVTGLRAMFNRPWPAEARVDTLARVGNVVGACIPVNLYEAVRTGALARGQRALLWGLGAGVSFGGVILTY